MPISFAPILLTGEDVIGTALALGADSQAVILRRRLFVREPSVRSGGLVVAEDGPVVHVFGFEKVEDRLLVALGFSWNMNMQIARVVVLRRHRDGLRELNLNLRRPASYRFDLF